MASKNVVTASIVVEFSTEGGEGILLAEVDGRDDGLNAGDTTFYPGSTPGILLFKSSNVVIDSIVVSEGSMGSVGTVTLTEEEWLTFANEKKASPKYPITGGGSLSNQANITGAASITETGVTYPSPQIGVAYLTYTTTAQQYRLNGASGTRPVVIFISGHTVAP